jgi:hypothetical protein
MDPHHGAVRDSHAISILVYGVGTILNCSVMMQAGTTHRWCYGQFNSGQSRLLWSFCQHSSPLERLVRSRIGSLEGDLGIPSWSTYEYNDYQLNPLQTSS